jgi:Cof subfamily protein (haloacid dehalogenase superfamily)
MSANTKKDIRLIAVDLDGTLLDPNSKITERAAKALRAALDKKLMIVLATGKTWGAVQPLVKQFGITTPSICLQGLAVYMPDGKVTQQQTLKPPIARQAITYAEDRGFTMLAYSGTRIMMRVRNEMVAERVFTRYHEPEPEIVGALQNLLEEVPLNKLAAVGEPRAIKALRWQLNVQIGGSARLVQAGVPHMLEIVPTGASKGAALRTLLKELKVDPSEVLAIGDAENDMEMIQLAGVGVAMGQAEQKIKDGADYVVASNAENGAAEAIERFALGIDPNAAPADEAKQEPAVESGKKDETSA